MWKALFKLLHTLVQYTVQLYLLTISKKASSCEVGILVIHSIHNVKDYMVYFGQYNKIACWQLKFVVNGLVLTCFRWTNSKIVLSAIELQKQIKLFSFHPHRTQILLLCYDKWPLLTSHMQAFYHQWHLVLIVKQCKVWIYVKWACIVPCLNELRWEICTFYTLWNPHISWVISFIGCHVWAEQENQLLMYMNCRYCVQWFTKKSMHYNFHENE